MTRRNFLKSSSAAVAAAGVAGYAGAADSAKAKDEVIARTKFIDIHAHCTEDPLPPCNIAGVQPLPLPDELISWYDKFGVEKGVVLSLCNPENFVGGMATETILRICEQHSDRLIPSVGIDPRCLGNHVVNNKFGYIFKWYRDKGCKVCGEVCANLHFLDPIMQNYFKGCEAAGLPLTFHLAADENWLYGIIDEKGMPELEICLQRFPNLRFFGHSQSFWCEIGTYKTWDERSGYPRGPVEEGRIPQLMRKYPNLYGDLSAGSGNNALARDLDYAGKFLTEFQDRIMFGIDICAPEGYVSPLDKTMKELLRTGRISTTVYKKVCRENQLRELGI
jgi:predicted TIM-barrel fold metal-dependent hydrolase